MSLMDINSTFKVKVLIVAIQRGDQVIIPTGNDILQAEGTIWPPCGTAAHYRKTGK